MRVKIIMVALLCLSIFQLGCVILPIPTNEKVVLTGKPVTLDQLSFLSANATTKKDVIEHLGNPTIIWEEARIFSYDWAVRDGIFVWMLAGGYTATGGIEDIPKRYSLIIQFDDHDHIKHFEKAVRPALQSYGGFLKEWVRKQAKTAPSKPANR